MLASGCTWHIDGLADVAEVVVPDTTSATGERVVETIPSPSELNARLAENGYALDDAIERRTAHAVLMAKAAAYQDIERRKSGIRHRGAT
jgi:hypothetical protein